MPYYTIWNSKQAGKISRVVYCDEDEILNQLEFNEHYLEGYYLDTDYYVKDDKPVERPDMELKVSKNEIKADGEDSVTISNIPTGCEVFCSKLPEDQQLFTVDDGEITFQTELKGSYIFQFKLFPYKECEVVINAN